MRSVQLSDHNLHFIQTVFSHIRATLNDILFDLRHGANWICQYTGQLIEDLKNAMSGIYFPAICAEND
jgi:hypothetical protein